MHGNAENPLFTRESIHLDTKTLSPWQIPYDHYISASTNSPSCWVLAKVWLADCKAGHHCEDDAPPKLPTRLIKVSRILDGLYARLVETEAFSENVPYCSLSHCWGRGDFFKLLHGNYEACLKEILYESLPPTFQDALYAAEKLGYEYIWIDSLCIIQQDSDDWAREALTMSSVYAGSDLNLAATLGSDSQSGLFATRDPITIVPCGVHSINNFDDSVSSLLVFDGRKWGNMIEKSQLGCRGWIFQERFLATRTLHFGPDQLYWECAGGSRNETIPWDMSHWSQSYGLAAVRKHRFYESWDSIVSAYSRTLLTFPSDKLIAISGIAQYLENIAQIETTKQNAYIGAGMWEAHLELQLLWEAVRFNEPAAGVRLQAYQAPSWSWTSLNHVGISTYPFLDHTGVCWDLGDFSIHHYLHTTIRQHLMEPVAQGSIFGQLASGLLELQCGQLKILPLLRMDCADGYLRLCDDTESIHFCLDEDIEVLGHVDLDEIFLLQIVTFCHPVGLRGNGYRSLGQAGLLLRKTKEQPKVFCRVGTFWINLKSVDELRELGGLAYVETTILQQRVVQTIEHKDLPADLHFDSQGTSIGKSQGGCFCTKSGLLINQQVCKRDEFMNRNRTQFNKDIDAENLYDYTVITPIAMSEWQGCRSFIWDNLPNAAMRDHPLPPTDSSSDSNEEKFIIKLV